MVGESFRRFSLAAVRDKRKVSGQSHLNFHVSANTAANYCHSRESGNPESRMATLVVNIHVKRPLDSYESMSLAQNPLKCDCLGLFVACC